jgi:hypothetical protein
VPTQQTILPTWHNSVEERCVPSSSGSEKLRGFADRLSAATYPVVFPGDAPTKLVRRGTLTCSAAGNCNFVLLSADTVTSVN